MWRPSGARLGGGEPATKLATKNSKLKTKHVEGTKNPHPTLPLPLYSLTPSLPWCPATEFRAETRKCLPFFVSVLQAHQNRSSKETAPNCSS